MTDDNFMNEFRAPDESMVDYMLELSSDLKEISTMSSLGHSETETLKQASHSMKVLLAMAIAGHHLFTTESNHADALASLVENLFDRLVMVEGNATPDIDISALANFRTFRSDFDTNQNLPLFGEE